MYCYKCGEKLISDSVFCHSCGSKIQNIEYVKENTVKETKDILINLFGKRMRFHENIREYMILRSIYEERAINYAEEFVNNMDKNYYDLDTFVKKAPKDIDMIYMKIIEWITADLNAKNVYSVNENHILDMTTETVGNWNMVFNEIFEKYQQLVGYQIEMTKYRTMKKNSRGRVIGGGFGLSGAAKGMITAGTINMTTGVFSSIFNSIGNSNTASEVRSKKSKIFKNSEIRNNFKIAIYNDILLMHYVHIDALESLANISMPSITLKNIDTAEVIYKNITSNKVPKNGLEDAFIDLFYNNPFQDKYYHLALKFLPYHFSEYEEIASLFSIELEEQFKYIKLISAVNVNLLLENRILKEMYNELPFDLKGCINLLKIRFGKDSRLSFYGEDDQEFLKKVSVMEGYFGKFLNEQPLILYDNTLWGSSKSGFVITDKNVYINEFGERSRQNNEAVYNTEFYIGSNNCKYIRLGDKNCQILNSELISNGYFKDIINFLLSMIIFHNYNKYLNSSSLIDALNEWKKVNDIADIINYGSQIYNTLFEDEILVEPQTINFALEENPIEYENKALIKASNPQIIVEEIEKMIVSPFIKKASDKTYISSYPSINRDKLNALKITIRMYPSIDLKNEIPIFYYDDGIINIGKSGFLLTNKRLYFHGKNDKGQYELDEITSLDYKIKNLLPSLVINYKTQISCKLMGHDATQEFVNVFFEIKDYLAKY